MKKFIVAAALLALAGPAKAQSTAQVETWRKPTEPLRVIGEVYYVGALGLSSWLIKTPAGDILIDGGMDYNAPLIEANLAKIGVKLSDVKILLNSHAHLDHAGGLAQIKKDTGATLYASAGDKPLLEGGYYPGREKDTSLGFPTVKVDQVVRDGQTVSLGGVTLTAHITPGHTPGCTTWTLKASEAGKTHDVMFYCSATVAGNKLVGPAATYPGIVDDYRRTFAEGPKIKADVFLAPHPEQFGFVRKRAALEANRAKASAENPFIDPTEAKDTWAAMQADFEKQLAAQTKALEQKK
jgi:metallo-beta-lactamase class B